MIFFRAWELDTSRTEKPDTPRKLIPEVYFRQVEKIVLYLTKHIVQWLVLVVVKYWFIVTTKIKKWLHKNYPRVTRIFKKKEKENINTKPSFLKRAILELKMKIKRTKEKVKREHEN